MIQAELCLHIFKSKRSNLINVGIGGRLVAKLNVWVFVYLFMRDAWFGNAWRNLGLKKVPSQLPRGSAQRDSVKWASLGKDKAHAQGQCLGRAPIL